MSRTFELDEPFRTFLVNVLILAADRYAEDEKLFLADENAGVRSVAPQFARQERQARALADVLNDAEGIALVGDHVTAGQIRRLAEVLKW